MEEKTALEEVCMQKRQDTKNSEVSDDIVDLVVQKVEDIEKVLNSCERMGIRDIGIIDKNSEKLKALPDYIKEKLSVLQQTYGIQSK